jgi:hypothetical protein
MDAMSERDGKAASKGSADSVTVYLASDRGRRLSWMIGGGVIGALLLWKFGTVAAGVGALLLAIGLYHTWYFVQTLRHAPGAFVIEARQVALPRGVCRGEPEKIESSTLGAAYFLRRAVPWNRSAPVLVIEAGDRAYVYPRDWFASEADQRRIMHALLPLISANTGSANTGSANTGSANTGSANPGSANPGSSSAKPDRVASAE